MYDTHVVVAMKWTLLVSLTHAPAAAPILKLRDSCKWPCPSSCVLMGGENLVKDWAEYSVLTIINCSMVTPT